MLRSLRRKIGEGLAWYLNQPIKNYSTFSVTPARILQACLRPGDVLLVEGDKRISVAIKYLTQSTWSHAAFYVGDVLGPNDDGAEPPTMIEADIAAGVVAVPLSKYRSVNIRICRPLGLTDDDRDAVVGFMVERIGLQYDLKHVFDLLRYLLPTPPVPLRWRRTMLALGSGDPTRAICSTLIAQAFQSVRYPILPKVRTERIVGRNTQRELYQMRHFGLFTPRDFDLSPYFQVVKPTLEMGFDYKELQWYEDPEEPDPAYRPGAEPHPAE